MAKPLELQKILSNNLNGTTKKYFLIFLQYLK
jgi:hypothetical protein